jgi:alpha-D-ribose 1-methylphosphonate 5-triphosphate synthase subunit PhnH
MLAIRSLSFAAILQLLDLDVAIQSQGWSALEHITRRWVAFISGSPSFEEKTKQDFARVIGKLIDKGELNSVCF